MKTNDYSDFSAKTKKVFIELPNYGFYHGPSTAKNKDNRVIGREGIIKRLTDIITNSESRTGAYLVTGYRGTGKSSLVNHVISNITQPSSYRSRIGRVLFLFFITGLVSLLIKHSGISAPIVQFIKESFFHQALIGFFFLFSALVVNRISGNYLLIYPIKKLFIYLSKALNEHTFYIFGRFYRFLPHKKESFWFMTFKYLTLFSLFITSLMINIFIRLLALIVYSLNLSRAKKQSHQHYNIIRTLFFLLVVQLVSFIFVSSNFYIINDIYFRGFIFGFICVYLLSIVLPYLYFNIERFYNNTLNRIAFKSIRRIRWIIEISRIKNGIFLFEVIREATLVLRKYVKMIFIGLRKYLNIGFLYSFFNFIKKTLTICFTWIKNIVAVIFNNRRVESIHINVGKSGLGDKTVLQIITYTILNSFRNREKKGIGWRVPGMIFILVIVHLFLKIQIIKDVRSDLARLYSFEKIFPSQVNPYFTNQDSLIEKYMAFYEVNHKYDYYKVYDHLYFDDTDSVHVFNNLIGKEYFFLNEGAVDDSKTILTRLKGTLLFVDITLVKTWKSFYQKVIDVIGISEHFDSRVKKIIDLSNVNYFYFIALLVAYLMLRINKRYFNFFGLGSTFRIEKRLERLNESILSSRERSESTGSEVGGTDTPFFFRIFKKRDKKYVYPIAQPRDIEMELINILNMIDNIPGYLYQPEYIIVFDEFDKISNHFEETISISERVEQSRIAVIDFLQSMKYFLTTAPVKFIIIAGRDMYENYLTDVSDRELHIRSIFNDVFYVNTFLSQPNDPFESKSHDITRLTEQYVAQFLIPEEWLVNVIPDLKEFNRYRKRSHSNYYNASNFTKGNNPTEMNSELFEEYNYLDNLQKQKDEKTLILLYQFVVYLLHMSNGIPKKIVSLFEEFVFKGEKNIIDFDNDLVCGKNPESFYLCFTPEKQYEIGFIFSLMSPIFYSLSNHLKNYNDKLLFSTTFLINHIFKYHSYAFSLNNLESSPEFTTFNRNIDVRNYLKKTINYLSQTYLDENLESLHRYKFPKQLSLEMNYLSRISEIANVTLNFSINEHRNVKDFYCSKIEELLKSNSNHNCNEVISYFYHSLGDVSYYEDDMVEAIRFYQLAIDYLAIEGKMHDQFSVGLSARISLKKALCYEKSLNYEEAISVYSLVIKEIAAYRDIEIDRMNAGVLIDKKGTEFLVSGSYSSNVDDLFVRNRLIKPENKELIEYDRIQEKMLNHLTKEKIFALQKITFFENSRVFYQPILARLHVQEKDSPDGVTDKDIIQAVREFEFFVRPVKKSEKVIGSSAFFKKIGNLLYYKNYDGDNNSFLKCNINALSFYLKSIKELISVSFSDVENLEIETNSHEEKSKLLLKVLFVFSDVYHNNLNLNYRPNSLQITAELLSSIGDCILSEAGKVDPIGKMAISDLDNFDSKLREGSRERGTERKEGSFYDGNFEIFSSFYSHVSFEQLGLFFYLVSSYYFLRAKKYKHSAFQVHKIFYIIHDIVFYTSFCSLTREKVKEIIENRATVIGNSLEQGKILHRLYRRAMRAYFGAYENVHNIQIEKYKEFLNEQIYLNDDIRDRVSLKKLSVDIDSDPLTFLYEKLKLYSKCKNVLYRKEVKKVFEKNLVSPYLLENSMFNRAIRLRFKSYLNYEIISEKLHEHFCPFETFEPKGYLNALKEIIQNAEISASESISIDQFEFLITDTLYCLAEIIEIYNTFGQENIFNHSFIAHVHDDMLFWLTVYRHYVFLLENIAIYADIGNMDLVKRRDPWKRLVDPLNNLSNNLSTNKHTVNMSVQTELTKIIETFKGTKNDYKDRVKNVKSIIHDSLRKDSINCLDPVYHGEQAILHYYTALDMHSQGKVYHQLIDRLYYLNDDFNDSFYQFRLAQERLRVNIGWIQKRRMQVSNFLKYTIIYDQENYVKTVAF
jgi:hypothetical protein